MNDDSTKPDHQKESPLSNHGEPVRALVGRKLNTESRTRWAAVFWLGFVVPILLTQVVYWFVFFVVSLIVRGNEVWVTSIFIGTIATVFAGAIYGYCVGDSFTNFELDSARFGHLYAVKRRHMIQVLTGVMESILFPVLLFGGCTAFVIMVFHSV